MLKQVEDPQAVQADNTRAGEQPAVAITGLATAVPEHRIAQDLAQTLAERIFTPRYPDFLRLSPAFANTGIEHRYSVCPTDWFLEERSWPERGKVYVEGAVTLYKDAAAKALASSGNSPSDIDILVTVSSTGIATPTLEARALSDLGFRADVRRVPVFGLGCAGGVTGLSIAERLARAEPGAKVLLVCLELCTLSFRSDRLRKADIIAAALFGDGAAAVCLCAGAPGPRIIASAEHTWPDTLNMMGWDVDDVGFGVIFDRSIPAFVHEELAAALDTCLKAMDVAPETIARLVCHPGGAKVLDAIETAMELETGTLDIERSVLRDFGNMSAPTVLFVLERVLDSGISGNLALSALGPGFTLSTLMLSHDG